MGLYVVIIEGCIMKQCMCKCIDNTRKSAVSAAGKETAQPERWVDELNNHFSHRNTTLRKTAFLHTPTVAQVGKKVIITSRLAALHPAMVPIVDQTNQTCHTIAFFGGPVSSCKDPSRRSGFYHSSFPTRILSKFLISTSAT
jgi:hypothetical protein